MCGNKMNTKEYYKKNYRKIFDAVKNPQWRIWKLVDEAKLVKQNKLQITTPERLLRFILKSKNPQALYVSISEFLNPHKVHGFFWNQKNTTRARYFYPRAGYVYADCMLLDSYFFVDCDDENDIKIAQQDARKIITYIAKNKKQLELKNIQFSGTKGVHLIYKRKEKMEIPNPINRIKLYKNQNERIINELLKLDLKTIDKYHISIMKNIFAVYAAPYSIKAKGGIVQPLSIDEFMNKDITLTIEAKANESQVATAGDKTSATQQYQGNERDGLISCPIYFKFVDNMVNGLKNNYVTVIKKHKKRFDINNLKELQRLYKLSDFYIYSLENYIYAYNFKINQFNRETKILRKIKSENLSYFLTRKHTPLPISETKTQDGKTIDRFQYVGILKSKYGMTDDHSRPHCDYFELDYNSLVGNNKINIGTMKVS